MKFCPSCETWKPKMLDYFQRDKTKSDGMCSFCKVCKAEKQWVYLRENNKLSEASVKRGELAKQGLKKCRDCGEIKPATRDYFQIRYGTEKSRHYEFPFLSYCIKCQTKRTAKVHKNRYKEDLEYRAKVKKRDAKRYQKLRKECLDVLKSREIKWRTSDKGRAFNRFQQKKRHAIKLKASPLWLSDSQYNEMRVIYSKAVSMEKKTGEKYHVDHIAPLQGENICGLHVPWNLEPLTAAANISKANRYDQKRLDTEQLAAAQYACQHWHELRTN